MLLNFPRGRSGLGLLILRVTAAGVIITFESNQSMGGASSMLSFAAIAVAILIAFGFSTSLSSAIVVLLAVTSLFVSHSGLMTNTIIAALCVSLSMLGGGVYSIDGLVHGRRRIIVPKT